MKIQYVYSVQFICDHCIISTTVTTDTDDEELILSIAVDNISGDVGYPPNNKYAEIELIEEMEYNDQDEL